VQEAARHPHSLAFVRSGAPLILRTDASSVGIGGALFQRTASGVEELVALYGRSLTPAERNYTTIEQEALAVLFCLEKAKPLIVGPVTLFTDHFNLQFIRSSSNPRIQRWASSLAQYELTIHHVPGVLNSAADFLSRCLAPTPHIAALRRHAPHSASRELDTPILPELIPLGPTVMAPPDLVQPLRAVLLAEGASLDAAGRVVLPAAPSRAVFAQLWALAHADPLSGHGGLERTLHRLQSAVAWPTMREDCAAFLRTCDVCQRERARAPHPATLFSTRANAPFESVMLDFIGPLPISDGKAYILTILDRFSHYLSLTAVSAATTAIATSVFFHLWICRFGPPILVTSDNAFATLFSDFCSNLAVRHHLSAAHHPEGHGAVERANRDVQHVLRSICVHQRRWTDLVKPVEFVLNTAYSRTLGLSPFEVLYGVHPRLPLRAVLESPHSFAVSNAQGEGSAEADFQALWSGDEPLEYSQRVLDVTSSLYPRIREIQTNLFKRELAEAQKKAKGKVDFVIGDYVLIAAPSVRSSLEFHWTGPFLVTGVEYNVPHQESG